MSKQVRVGAILVCAVLIAAAAIQGAAAEPPSRESRDRCLRMHGLWMRYETANCPNQTGQRAQAEWALSRCQVDDVDRGRAELERLLRRDLIRLP